MLFKTSVTATAIAAALLVGGGGVHGQPRRPAGVFDADAVIDANASRMTLLRTQYNLADERLSEYLQQSMLSIQQGHRTGFQHFRVWFRDIRNANQRASIGVAQAILKFAFPKFFDAILPGSSAMAKEMLSYWSTLEAVDKALKIPEGEVELFLDRLQAAEELRIAQLLDMPKQFKQNHRDEWNAAKLEYLELRLQDPSVLSGEAVDARAADRRRDPNEQQLPESVLGMMNTLGVPPPGSPTAKRVAEDVLAGHILTVMQSDGEWRNMWPYSEREYATAHALRVIDRAGNAARICEVTRSWTYFRVIPRKECDALPQR